MQKYLLVLAISFAGSVIQGSVSFGYAIFVMSLLPFIMPLKEAAVITAISTLFIGGTVCWQLRKVIDYKAVWVPLVAALLFVPPGVYLLTICREDILKKLLGVLMGFLSVFFQITAGKKVRIKPNLKNQIVAGALSGLLNGMFNIGGPPVVFYYLNTMENNLSYKASLEFTFMVYAILTLTTHGLYGNIRPEIFPYIIVCFFATVLGSLWGLKIFQKLPKKLLIRLVYLLMLVLGMLLIVK